MRQVRIQKPKPRRQKPDGAEDGTDLIRESSAATARARDLSARLRSLAREIDIALGLAP